MRPAAAVACHGSESLCREDDDTLPHSGVCHIIESLGREDDDDDAPGSGVYVNVNPVA